MRTKYMYPSCLEQWKYQEGEYGEELEKIDEHGVVSCERIKGKCTINEKGRNYIIKYKRTDGP